MNWVKKAPAYAGSIILFLGAGFHYTGLPLVKKVAIEIENPFIQAALEPIWLFPVTHWAVFALLVLLVTLKPSHHSKWVLIFISISVIADAALISLKLGPFIGAIMLAVAGSLILFSAILFPWDRSIIDIETVPNN